MTKRLSDDEWKTVFQLRCRSKQGLELSRADREEKDSGLAAPSPAARFPASNEGWTDAIAYARGKG